MPVFNEAAALGPVVGEWLPVLTRCTGAVRALRRRRRLDGRHARGASRAGRGPRGDRAVRRTNGGHGRACLQGYRLGLRAARADRPDRLRRTVRRVELSESAPREQHPVVFGHRRVRLDGWRRRLVSRTLALGAASATGVSVRDPNVPYRLVDAAVLRDAVDAVPDDVDLVNVYLAVLLEARAASSGWTSSSVSGSRAVASRLAIDAIPRPRGAPAAPPRPEPAAQAGSGRAMAAVADSPTPRRAIERSALGRAVGLASIVYLALPVGVFLALAQANLGHAGGPDAHRRRGRLGRRFSARPAERPRRARLSRPRRWSALPWRRSASWP